jgi:hypothetical protein
MSNLSPAPRVLRIGRMKRKPRPDNRSGLLIDACDSAMFEVFVATFSFATAMIRAPAKNRRT